MVKGKTIYWLLVPILVVGMVLLPFPAMETAEASSVSNAWVELSHATALNKTSAALEYIIHFTTTTALSGGKDTITVANTPTNLPGYSQVISPSMNSSDWTYSSGQSYTDEDMLVGEGYWIYMQNDCTLVGFTITPIEPSLD
jgi:hypothetical protein